MNHEPDSHAQLAAAGCGALDRGRIGPVSALRLPAAEALGAHPPKPVGSGWNGAGGGIQR